MTSTTFVDLVGPPVNAAWLNDVNRKTYGPPQSSDSSLVGFIQSGTGAVARTVQDKARESVSVKDFGAIGDSVADDTAAIQAALTASNNVYVPAGTYLVSASLTLKTKQKIYGDGAISVITTATANLNLLSGTSVSGVVIRDLKFNVTATPGASSIGIVTFITSDHCAVENCEFVGAQWAGVWLSSSTYCNVIRNYFHDFLGSFQDSADICVYNNSTFNLVEGNKCYGGNSHGVFVQDATGSSIPAKNIISKNAVGQHTSYGIVVYQSTAADNFSIIEGNTIQDIQGTALAGASGTGIYIVGAGGCIVRNNVVQNCCVATSLFTLAPAGIGVVSINTPREPVSVIGNTIDNMTKYEGILISQSSAGAIVQGNTIRMPTANTTGDAGIMVLDSNNVTIQGNRVTVTPTTGTTVGGIMIQSSAAYVLNTSVTGNVVIGGNNYGIRTYAATFTVQGITISGNVVYGGGSSSPPLNIANVFVGSVTGNNFNGTYANGAIYHNASTRVRYSGNTLVSSVTYVMTATGVNTSSHFDKSNYWDTTSAPIFNTGTGMTFETLNNGTPGTGTAAVGDRIEQSIPIVGNPKGWRCTVAGNPGTWVSEGNL